MQKTEIDKIINEILEEKRRKIGYIITDDEYILKREGDVIKIIRPGYCIPSSSKYPIDPRIDCFETRILLETKNPIEIIDKLIEMIHNKISSLYKTIDYLREEQGDEYVEELDYYGDVEKYEKALNILKEVKEGKLRKGIVRIGRILELDLDKLFS